MDRRSKERWKSKRIAALFVFASVTSVSLPAYAWFGGTASNVLNDFSTATLQTATGLAADTTCDGTNLAKITLNWTATSSNFADGYDIYRSSVDGGPYSKIDHMSGRTTTTFTNSALSTNSSYFYVVQSTAINWTSNNSNQTEATTPTTC